VKVTLQARNVEALRFYLDGRQQLSSASSSASTQSFTVPAAAGAPSPSKLRIEGYTASVLAAVTTVPLQAEVPPDDDLTMDQ
jgi:hypothetical protein